MYKVLTISMTVLLLAGATAWAEAKHDTFWATLEGDNQLFTGGGSGWSSAGGEGEWIYYDQTNWWNQWFYDDPPDPDRWKEISYDITVETYPTGMGFDVWVELALNWSTIDFPETGPAGPPPQPHQEEFIERWEIYSGSPMGPESVVGDYVIPDYNPEWISIDVYVWAWEEIENHWELLNGPPNSGEWVPTPVDIAGDIWHECVPEPATLGLLLLGGLALLRRRR